MFAHFLGSIADHAQRVRRHVPEQAVEVAAIERTTWDVVRRVGDLHFVYTKNNGEATKTCTQKKGTAGRTQLRRNHPHASFSPAQRQSRDLGRQAARGTITVGGAAAAGWGGA